MNLKDLKIMKFPLLRKVKLPALYLLNKKVIKNTKALENSSKCQSSENEIIARFMQGEIVGE